MEFLGDPDSCQSAHSMVVQRCPECTDCSALAAGRECVSKPPAAPPVRPCEALCEVGGQLASCSSHTRLAAEYTFRFKPNACASAFFLVQQQCSGRYGCRDCTLEATRCSDNASYVSDGGDASGEATTVRFQRKFPRGNIKAGSSVVSSFALLAVAATLALGLCATRRRSSSRDETAREQRTVECIERHELLPCSMRPPGSGFGSPSVLDVESAGQFELPLASVPDGSESTGCATLRRAR